MLLIGPSIIFSLPSSQGTLHLRLHLQLSTLFTLPLTLTLFLLPASLNPLKGSDAGVHPEHYKHCVPTGRCPSKTPVSTNMASLRDAEGDHKCRAEFFAFLW
jgi:hypothetical protein